MSDKLKTTLPNVPQFADGEQPTAAKLNNSFKVIQDAFGRVEQSIGDITIKSTSNDILSDRPLANGNVGRFLGGIQGVQPNIPTDDLFTFELNLETGRNVWHLPIWPSDKSTLDVSVVSNAPTNSIGSPLFVTKKAATDALVVVGDWKYDPENNIIMTFDILASGTATAAGTSYLNADKEIGLGEYKYPGDATPNVMPPFEEASPSSISLATSTDTSYDYIVTLGTGEFRFISPIYGTNGSHLEGNAFKDKATSREVIDFGVQSIPEITSDVQYRLPYTLDNLSAGDPIPRPFVLLYDETNDIAYETAQYFYRDSTSFFFKGPSITDTAAHRVLTNGGNDVSAQLEALIHNQKYHKHRGPSAISHADNANLGYAPTLSILPTIVSTDKRLGWHKPTQKSEIPGNDHPQYLMRNGYDFGIDNANLNNLMIGPLGLAQKPSNISEKSSSDVWDFDGADSHPIIFGGRAEMLLKRGGSFDYLSIAGKSIGTAAAQNIAVVTNNGSALSYIGQATDVLALLAGDIEINGQTSLRTIYQIAGSDVTANAELIQSHLLLSGDEIAVEGSYNNCFLNFAGTNNDLNSTSERSFIQQVGADNIGLCTSLTNTLISIVGNNSTCQAGTILNSKVEFLGQGYRVNVPDATDVSIEVLSTSVAVDINLPSIDPATKYFKADNLYADLENKIIRRPIRKNEITFLGNAAGTSTDSKAQLVADVDYLSSGTDMIYAEVPAALGTAGRFFYEFDLPGDAQISEIRIRSIQEASPVNTTYDLIYFNEEGLIISTATSTSFTGGVGPNSAVILNWTLATDIGYINGDRFPSSSNFGMAIVSNRSLQFEAGWYKYRLMRF